MLDNLCFIFWTATLFLQENKLCCLSLCNVNGTSRVCLGRLWQTLILRAWRPLLAYLSVEIVIHLRQEGYYQALAQSNQQVSPFIEFMLGALLEAMAEATTTDQVPHYCGHLGPVN